MKHVLITGGAGFIGSHLCDAFLSRGYAVTAVDNLITGHKRNLEKALTHKQFQFIQKDVSQSFDELFYSSLKQINEYGLFGVLHFACPASPVDFEKIPFDILAVDSLGTFNSVDLALKFNARYLLATTSEIYGDPMEHPQKETYWGNVNTLGPRACYDEAKRFAEALVGTAMRGVGTYKGKSYKPLNAAMVRIFNTYGPRMRPDDGRVVPEFCMKALQSEPIRLQGTGNQTRSFCYVDDLVEGIVMLFESAHKDVINLGNPIERTVKNLAELIIKQSNSRSQFVFESARQDDPMRRCPDISKAKKLLGWEPKTNIEDGINRSLQYFRQFL